MDKSLFSSNKGSSFPADDGKGMMTWLAREKKMTCEDHMVPLYEVLICITMIINRDDLMTSRERMQSESRRAEYCLISNRERLALI